MIKEMKGLNPKLKQCSQCHTMKLFTTKVCYRCLDRNEARREVIEMIKEYKPHIGKNGSINRERLIEFLSK